MNYEIEISSRLAREAADASMVGRMRLVLSIAAVLTIFIDPEGVDDVTGLTQLVFCGYTLHSIVLYVLSQLDQPFLHSKMIHWLDVGWYALIVFFYRWQQQLFLPLLFLRHPHVVFSLGF
ncbi:hypothetical protein ACFQAT_03500 [Undibacterium arcticum]|uniref:hypothetical protein n=1 Tax=Undibacterium arcticum TaxID=1762892 RepID=UPI00361A9553